MSRIVNVQAGDDYMLFLDFEDGSNIAFNMKKLVNSIPYFKLKEPSCFQRVKFDDKFVYWDATDEKPEYLPLRLSIDTILFSLRD